MAGTFNQSLQCTQDVFIGFQAPSPPVSSKQSASAAGMGTDTEALGSKQQWVKNNHKKTCEKFTTQVGKYATEKFSDSFSISHILSLLVESEDHHAHMAHQLTHSQVTACGFRRSTGKVPSFRGASVSSRICLLHSSSSSSYSGLGAANGDISPNLLQRTIPFCYTPPTLMGLWARRWGSTSTWRIRCILVGRSLVE